jgi:hypothetical protein
LECRFYHASVAGSYLTGGSNGNAQNAASEKAKHCSHVLRPAAAGGCTAAATPTPAPASASSLSLLASMAVVAISIVVL